jgi:hypothetical protein
MNRGGEAVQGGAVLLILKQNTLRFVLEMDGVLSSKPQTYSKDFTA